MPETYYNNEDGFPEESVNGNLILCSFNEGVRVCSEAGPLYKNIVNNVKNAFNLVFEVLPNFMSIGLFGLLLADYTTVFDILGYIFYPLTMLLQIPEPLLAAKAAFLGLPEMYLPVLVVVKAPELTKFIIGVLSVTQVIMLSTTVPCILATKIPINLKDMLIIWFERTVVSLIIITPISYMIFKFI
jgi:nucleoside recognition membrane protein YjiH